MPPPPHTTKVSFGGVSYVVCDLHCVVLQGSLQEQEDSESDSSLSQSPNVQDWLAEARTTRSQKHQDSLQRQRVHFHALYQYLQI